MEMDQPLSEFCDLDGICAKGSGGDYVLLRIFLEDAEGEDQKGDGDDPFSPEGKFFPQRSAQEPGKGLPFCSNLFQVSHKRQCVKKGNKFSKF